MQRLNLAFSIQNFVELRERLLFIYLRSLHRCVQRFHRVLQLPLQFVEARGGPLNLAAHELLLLVSQTEFALMLHDHVGRKHRIRQRIVGRQWLPRLTLRHRTLRRL